MESTPAPGFAVEPFEVTTGTVVPGGRCLCRHEGKVVLVAGALPGERCRVRVTRDEKRYAEAEVEEVLEAHARRREPPCEHAAECGGCDWQYAERDLQLSMKREIVVDAFRRIAPLDVADVLEGPTAVGDEFRSRHRIRLTTDPAGRPGLLRRGSHDVVPLNMCLQMQEEFEGVALPWVRMLPPWKRVTVRYDDEGQSVVLLDSGKGSPSERDRRRLGKITKAMERPASIVGLVADSIPLAGERTLRFHVGDRTFRADATSFFQGTRAGTLALLDTVDEFLGEDRGGPLLDLYAGVGLFSVCLGSRFSPLVAAEADARAVRHLKHNLKRNGVRGEARAERTELTLASLPRGLAETVILDPPRVGLSKDARRALVAREPRRIVSVSCDPATGARDAGILVRAGWRLKRLRAIDLFPTTAHVETVALLVRS